MNRLRQLKVLFVLLSVALLFACAKKQVVLTPEQEADRVYYEAKYVNVVADMKFTQSLTKYNLWCSDEAYKEVCAKIDPLWLKADKALDIWGQLVDSRQPAADAEGNFQAELKLLKTKLLMEIPDYSW